MFNISDLSALSSLFVSGVESQSKETLMVMLPIVGITVVLFSLALLAIVLTQLSRVEKFANFKEWKSSKKESEKAVPKEVKIVTPPVEKGGSDNEDEMTAISVALHLFIQGATSDPVILTEQPVDNSGWMASARSRQNATFNKWQSSKR
jgi:Na+-transporting methylmalonyl-CoA/oxaloacetate decarboxylase gamma subunit